MKKAIVSRVKMFLYKYIVLKKYVKQELLNYTFLQCIQLCTVLSVRPFVWGLAWRGSVMPKPSLTKENTNILDVLPDVSVKKSLLLSLSYSLGFRVKRLKWFLFPLGDKCRQGQVAMSSSITFNGDSARVKYPKTRQLGHIHPPPFIQGMGVGCHTACCCCQVKTIFHQ